jgi:hypothetical protein
MTINITNGMSIEIQVQDGSDVGSIRAMRQKLEEIGAPESFSFAVNGVGVEDSYILQEGDNVSMRPKSGEKGSW